MKNIHNVEIQSTTELTIPDSDIRLIVEKNLPDIKNRIMNSMHEIGLHTQGELAAALHISREFLCDILNGHKPFPVERLKDIAALFEWDMRYLLGFEDIDEVYQNPLSSEEYLKYYLFSMGLENDEDNKKIVLRQAVDNKIVRYAIPYLDFEGLLKQIDTIVSDLVKITFEHYSNDEAFIIYRPN